MKRILAMMSVAGLAACGPDTNTNTRACDGLNPGDLVITEVMIDPAGADSGNEWIEIFNTLGSTLDLKGMTLFVQAVDGTGAKTHNIRAGSAPGRGFFTFGDVRSGPNPAWIGYSYSNALGSLNNSSGTVGLKCGTKVITSYTWTEATKPNHSRMVDGTLEITQATADDAANSCDTPDGNVYSDPNVGTPGLQNPACGATTTTGTCVDLDGTSRLVVHPDVGELVITEVMSHPAAVTSTNGEWVELYAQTSVDLNGLTLKGSSTTAKIESAQCLHVEGNHFAVLARNGDASVNGGLPLVDFAYGSLQIPDNGEQQLTLQLGDTVIDLAKVYGSSAGKSWQLDRDQLDPDANDDSSAFCLSDTAWAGSAGDLGSPGAENAVCPIAVAGDQCFDDGLQMNRAIRLPEAGQLVFTEWLPNPKAVADSAGEFVEGLATTDFDLNGVTLQIGSSKKTVVSPNCVPVTGGSYLVFGVNADSSLNGGLPPLAGSMPTLANGPGVTLSFLGPDGGLFDSVTTVMNAADGKSTQIAPGFENATDNDDPAHRCYAPTPWNPDGGGDLGSPGQPNPACSAGTFDAGVDAGMMAEGMCLDGTTGMLREIRIPADGTLVITEWMADPSAVPDTAGEYVEVLSTTETDLNSVSLQVGSATSTFADPACRPVPAGTFLVFGHNASPAANGNLPPLAGTFTAALINTGPTVITVLGADGGTYDTVTASGQTAGASTELQPTFMLPADNDVAANLCVTPVGTTYGLDGGDRGTPGLPNVCP